MIDTKDLRIGNLISMMDGHKVEVDINMLRIMENESSDILFDPIQLTNALLIKVGGVNMGGWVGLYYIDRDEDEENEIEFCFQLMDGYLTFYCNDNIVCVYDKPYFHQLQNLYYAIIGIELKYPK